jgi:hypothetical protein
MAYVTVQKVSIATGASKTDPIPVAGFDRVSIVAQTFSVFCETASVALALEGSSTATTSTFRPARATGSYSAGAGLLQWEVPAGVGNYIVACDPATWSPYIRLSLGANTATASASIDVVLIRNS